MSAKLHELLAIEKDKKKTTQAILSETNNTFNSKKNHFEGSVKRFEPLKEDEQNVYQDEESHIVTSVDKKLSYFNPYISDMMNVIYQKESANCEAKSDVIIEGEDGEEDVTIMSNVPVQALVQYEKLLTEVKQVYLNIPTNDPKHQWSPDESRGEGYWKTSEQKRIKTRKVEDHVVVVQATDKFPAQVARKVTDEVEGHWIETKFSGMMTPAEKSELLERTEKVIAAVKKARARANQSEVQNSKVAKPIFDYIMG